MPNILVIDDQQCIRELLSEELALEGYQVHSVGDVESVREHLQLFQPELVLLDLYLEGPEGFALLEDIKRQHPHLPVIIVTAYDSFMNDSRLSQADGYVIKSSDLDPLKQEIAHVLGQQKALEASTEAWTRYPERRATHAF